MPSQASIFSSPSALRNRGPIFEVLRDILPETGTVLEIASGSGEHITYFAERLPTLIWQPSDPSLKARASIQERLHTETFQNLLPPLDIDTMSGTWPIEHANAMVAINMVHISPWAATQGLLKGAGRVLPDGGTLTFYGPYRQEGKAFAESNVEFDAWLRARDPAWGVRQLEDVVGEAQRFGLTMTSVVEMPTNNLTVTFQRS